MIRPIVLILASLCAPVYAAQFSTELSMPLVNPRIDWISAGAPQGVLAGSHSLTLQLGANQEVTQIWPLLPLDVVFANDGGAFTFAQLPSQTPSFADLAGLNSDGGPPLSRLDNAGKPVWQVALGAQQHLVQAADSTLWSQGPSGLYQITADGELKRAIPATALGTSATLLGSALAAHASNGVYLAWRSVVNNAIAVDRTSNISYLDDSGTVRWRYTDSDDSFVPSLQRSGSNLIAAGDGEGLSGTMLKLNSAGALQWRLKVGRVADWRAQVDGGAVLLTYGAPSTAIAYLSRFNASGGEVWRTQLRLGAQDGLKLDLLQLGNSFFVHAQNTQSPLVMTPARIADFFRIDADGVILKTKQIVTPIIVDRFRSVGANVQGSFLGGIRDNSARLAQAVDGKILYLGIDAELMVLDSDLNLTPVRINADARTQSSKVLQVSNRTAAGPYILELETGSEYHFDRRRQLQGFDASGRALWQRDNENPRLDPWQAEGNRLCGIERNAVEYLSPSLTCLSAETGTQLFSVPLGENGYTNPVLSLDATGINVFFPQANVVRRRYSNIGQLVFDQETFSWTLASGRYVRFSGSPVERVELFDPNANLIYSQPVVPPTLPSSLRQITSVVEADQNLYVRYALNNTDSTFFGAELERRGVAGEIQWRVPVSPDQSSEIIVGASNVYLINNTANDGVIRYIGLASVPRYPTDSGRYQIVCLDKASGAERWHYDLDTTLEIEKAVGIREFPNENALRIAGSTSQGDEVHIALTLQTGELLSKTITRQNLKNRVIYQALESDGVLKLESRTSDAGVVKTLLHKVPLPDLVPAQLFFAANRVGSWHHPSRPGQGVFLDVIGNQFFGAWFTTKDAGLFPDSLPVSPLVEPLQKLHWYTLNGIVTPGAKDVLLDVYENVGGVFAAPPITQGAPVAKARVRFQDCAAMVFEYQINFTSRANPPWAVMPLMPLVGANPNCGQGVSKSSGAWFDPATSGQGMMVAIDESNVVSPTFFAGWFTYDPENASDDADKQTWFTLLGVAPTNAGITSTVKIYRTLGQQFDSSDSAFSRAVGEAQVRLDGCVSLTVSYRFYDGIANAPFTGKTGQLNLRKIAGCQ